MSIECEQLLGGGFEGCGRVACCAYGDLAADEKLAAQKHRQRLSARAPLSTAGSKGLLAAGPAGSGSEWGCMRCCRVSEEACEIQLYLV